MIRRMLGGATAALAVAASLVAPGTAAHADELVPISGSGSTWAQKAVDLWRRDVAIDSGMTVSYSGSGSAAGLSDFANETVDFAVADMPFGADPADGLPTPPSTP